MPVIIRDLPFFETSTTATVPGGPTRSTLAAGVAQERFNKQFTLSMTVLQDSLNHISQVRADRVELREISRGRPVKPYNQFAYHRAKPLVLPFQIVYLIRPLRV